MHIVFPKVPVFYFVKAKYLDKYHCVPLNRMSLITCYLLVANNFFKKV